MKNIGKYEGIPCYECTYKEYVDAYNKDLDTGKQIFIVDGNMVRQNVIIGYYDGKHVKDYYDGKVFYVKMPDPKKTATVTAENSKWNEKITQFATGASYEEMVAKEIRFSDYSTIVDEFFAKLEA